tara:strand:- start:954 stop:2351 length:1398 start_codon:yes stop_codon:yes gene_type:complete
MKTNLPYKLIIILILVSSLFAHSRVSFSRPSSFVRSPSSVIDSENNKYFIGFANDAINTQDMISSNAVYFKATSKQGYEYGIAYTQNAPISLNDKNPPSEVSFHFNKEVFKKNNFLINMGIQDAFYQTEGDNQLSLFVSFINNNILLNNNIVLQTAIGAGSGKINYDSYNYLEENSKTTLFFGLKFQTNILEKYTGKGIDFMIDYDGVGLNFGTSLPITNQIGIKMGLTHLENIDNFNIYQDPGTETIYSDAPGFSIGFEYGFIPQKSFLSGINQEPFKIQNIETKEECFFLIEQKAYNNPLTVNQECNDSKLVDLVNTFNLHVSSLHDSLIWQEQKLRAEKINNSSLKKQTKTLQDSVNMQYLNQQISQSEMNIAMRFLSNSLKYYYIEDYFLALEEINKAQKYLPQLAYTYAREGSIYYKLGNLQQATMNWNIALQLDPEYTEVREMLTNIKQETGSESSDIN